MPQHQNQSDVDGGQIVPFARMQKKTGMASIKSNSSKPTKTFKYKIHSKRILPKPKTQDKFNIRTLSTPKTTRYPQNPQPTQTQSFNVLDRYAEQIHLRREWEEKMERLNEKYGLNSFSDSELGSESDEGENYQYEHKYKTLI